MGASCEDESMLSLLPSPSVYLLGLAGGPSSTSWGSSRFMHSFRFEGNKSVKVVGLAYT